MYNILKTLTIHIGIAVHYIMIQIFIFYAMYFWYSMTVIIFHKMPTNWKTLTVRHDDLYKYIENFKWWVCEVKEKIMHIRHLDICRKKGSVDFGSFHKSLCNQIQSRPHVEPTVKLCTFFVQLCKGLCSDNGLLHNYIFHIRMNFSMKIYIKETK